MFRIGLEARWLMVHVLVCAGGVVCVGVSCLDLMLLGATGEGEAFGTINTYQQQVEQPSRHTDLSKAAGI